MTREQFLVNLFLVSDEEGTDGDVSQALKDHDQTQRETIAEQRAEIARLKNDLSHWTFTRLQQLESENKSLREALKEMVKAYNQLLPGISKIAVQDYANINEAPILAKQALKETL